MPVRVTMDAFRSRSFAATVRRISTYVLDREKQARTVEVEAELLALEDRPTLLAGYSADMEIVIAKQEQALRVPTDLLVDERFVFVLNADNRIERRAVELGLANWHFTQIVSGLESGDAIVGNIGTKGVVEGTEVAVVDAP
jgi:HlyD family secretion protein